MSVPMQTVVSQKAFGFSPAIAHSPQGEHATVQRTAIQFGGDSVFSQVEARRAAFLEQKLFEVGDTVYTGLDVLKAIKMAVKKRRRNPLLWLAMPFWLGIDDCNPNYVSRDHILKCLPNFSRNDEEQRTFDQGLNRALESMVNTNFLKKGKFGENNLVDAWAIQAG